MALNLVSLTAPLSLGVLLSRLHKLDVSRDSASAAHDVLKGLKGL
jgi:hypothetical protein